MLEELITAVLTTFDATASGDVLENLWRAWRVV
jgi:hypothetical protein